MPEDKGNIYVVDDDDAVRKSLQLLFKTVGIEAVGFESGDEFLHAFDNDWQGCIVLDIRMPGMSGMELQDALIASGISLPVIFLTAHGNVPMSARAFRKGAVDFMEKPFDESDLLERISEAIQLDRTNREAAAKQEDARTRLATLTPREHQVMLLTVAGKANKEIAAELELSHRTVEIHRGRVMEKTAARSLTSLIELAVASGFHQLD
jgi:FixJ family two-component response regulator